MLFCFFLVCSFFCLGFDLLAFPLLLLLLDLFDLLQVGLLKGKNTEILSEKYSCTMNLPGKLKKYRNTNGNKVGQRICLVGGLLPLSGIVRLPHRLPPLLPQLPDVQHSKMLTPKRCDIQNIKTRDTLKRSSPSVLHPL